MGKRKRDRMAGLQQLWGGSGEQAEKMLRGEEKGPECSQEDRQGATLRHVRSTGRWRSVPPTPTVHPDSEGRDRKQRTETEAHTGAA